MNRHHHHYHQLQNNDASSSEVESSSSSWSSTALFRPPQQTAQPLRMRLIQRVAGMGHSCCRNPDCRTATDNITDRSSLLECNATVMQYPGSLQHELARGGQNSVLSPFLVAPMLCMPIQSEPISVTTKSIIEHRDGIIVNDDSISNSSNNKTKKNKRPPRVTASKAAISTKYVANTDATTRSSAVGKDDYTQHQHYQTRFVELIISEYISACHFYGCGDRINAGVLTSLRFNLPSLRVSCHFFDADMLALGEILLKYANGPLSYIERLDFSRAGKAGKLFGYSKSRPGFRSHGALTLAKVLQTSKYIKQVFVNRHAIGAYGAAALFLAAAHNPVLEKLVLRRCQLGERGGLAFAEFIDSCTESADNECGLREIDLSANCLGFKATVAVEQALQRRAKVAASRAAKVAEMKKNDNHANNSSENGNSEMTHVREKQSMPLLDDFHVNLDGNLVIPEIMNGVTHGLSVVLSVVGSWLLVRRASHHSTKHVVSCVVYSVSLFTMYISSTLYHSFFTMQHTKLIFRIIDKCAIYILIAGSYTPILQISLGHDARWSRDLLAFIWTCAVLGVGVEIAYPNWKWRKKFSLSMYLGMGWASVVCLPEVQRIMPVKLTHALLLGGVAYTAGVPFFVRNNNLDHAVWHVFVSAGSLFHWLGIFFYVANYEIEA